MIKRGWEIYFFIITSIGIVFSLGFSILFWVLYFKKFEPLFLAMSIILIGFLIWLIYILIIGAKRSLKKIELSPS